MGSVNSSQLKPIPSSADEFKAEYDTFKKFDENSDTTPRALLSHFMLSSVKIQRHPEFAMILLIGSCGCGKSSTMDHLLNIEDPVAKISNEGSANRKTSEYILTFDEPSYEVCDLVMSVIDTPGFNDIHGVKQDACNFVSIQQYFRTHPKFPAETKIYPNLVFFVAKADDTRMKGTNSQISKCLRGIKLLDVVDISHPNLVVILTFVCSVGFKNPEKWQVKMQEKKNLVSDLVFEILGVRTSVVLIENDPLEEYELEKDGDFTILPNGERQPLNLYNACLSLLDKSRDGKEKRDKFGHMVLNAAFKQKKKERPTNGYEVKAKDSKKEPLSQEELEFANELIEAPGRDFDKEMSCVATSQLKPMPSSNDEFIAEYETIKKLDENSEPTPRASLYSFILSSSAIQRHSEFAMILLVGTSGCGKSSTINHLLDIGDGTPVAKTSNVESTTRKTSEYTLTFDEPNYEVCDLVMSVIDTPGFNDSDGVDQDACNFVSIQQYFRTHPKFPAETKIYPNLVFFVAKADDTRMKGTNSQILKSLRGIKLLDVVDVSHPNLVVILTFVCSVGFKNPEKWQVRMQEKKNLVSDLVFQILGIRAPVVLVENDPLEDFELEKDGDFTILPNGERQPLNLYNACLSLLEKSRDGKEKRDKFGHMVLNAAFKQKKKDRPTNGYEVRAKDSNKEPLSQEELELTNAFIQASRGGDTNPLVIHAMDYLTENDIQEESVKKEILELVETMNSMGLSNKSNLKHTTISEINYHHTDSITEHGLQMLEKKFRMKCADITSFHAAEFIGQGYNVVINKSVPAQVLKFSVVDNKQFGFKIPECAQIMKLNETRTTQIHTQSHESYIRSRLLNFGLNVNIAPAILKIAPKFDMTYSEKRQKSDSGSSTTKKELTEVRIAKINVGEFKSKKIAFTDAFLSVVSELPKGNMEEKKAKQKFTDFFNRFGQFVVTSAYVGGAVEVETCDDNMKISNKDEDCADGGIDSSLPGALRFSGKHELSVNKESNQVSSISTTQWKGGRSDLHDEGTLHSNEKFLEWKTSIANDPVFLTNELTMEPISTFVGMIDVEKGNLCYQALQKLFQNKHLNLHNDNVTQTKSLAKGSKNSNTRVGSTKDPDTSDWSKMFGGHAKKTGAGVLTVIGFVVGAVCIAIFFGRR
ncbi:uncharacterized protein LOC124446034 [Xenia sp. Carnegie-2017]|uniref:uncharacterized protein LOC124446034 n=1 Tax=Xenia sp. Carnegie-2017 TaxID=2897299 RepID=UPI001F045253|nr:uncharacterized protein LOC124446034 [Xenia sp. Carnegie-2017]XP_046852783.1 uncharacterized protein LOC124446034 [Xenia sp. Carnegie-2017]